MRVIAGLLSGRQFDAPGKVGTHPMSEKVRGAMFNALGDIGGLSVLDAFAGSGALAFEAASRGASGVLMVEKDKSAQKSIAENIKKLGLENNVKLIKAGAGAWLTTNDASFDIVLLDPPYDNLQPELLTKLAARSTNLIVLSLPPTSDFTLSAGYELLTKKTYGDATLAFYRRAG